MEDLFFDCRYIRIDHHDGISRFTTGLFTELSKITNVTAIISDLRQLDKLPSGTQFVKLSAPTSALEPLIARKINRTGAKVVFSPMQTIGSFGRKFKLVLTVHDLIYYRHPAPPRGFSIAIRALWRLYHLVYWPQRLLLNRADAVVTVSETTKRLIKEYNLTKRPVQVVYNAPESAASITKSPSRPTGQQSLVYMGSFMDYKNVEVLISSMKHLPNYQLELLSKISPERKHQLEKLISSNTRVIFHNGVSEVDYHNILSNSVALVTGSRDEGFGIPLVESMSRGIPIVVSDIDIFREIGGDAAIYFDQESELDFVRAIKTLESESEWLARSAKCNLQSQNFSWTNSARSLLQLLKQI
ncbi:MAG: hypothetical protein RL733_1185 [Actinomycetota bacterium]|jgi:glycosyltransferase involved in cell wall biosynthesis